MGTTETGAEAARGGHRRDRAFDEALGARLRALRIAAGRSQSALGEAVGVSFQQVQKYERGVDRIAVGTMVAMARSLGVPAAALLDEVEAPAEGGIAGLREATRLARRVGGLSDRRVRHTLGALVEVLAGGGDGGG